VPDSGTDDVREGVVCAVTAVTSIFTNVAESLLYWIIFVCFFFVPAIFEFDSCIFISK